MSAASHAVGSALARTSRLLPRRTDWTAARPARDLTAGLMVGLVALPLALGFGVSSGMGAPPMRVSSLAALLRSTRGDAVVLTITAGALELTDVTRVRVVILRMSRVTAIDATGAHVLADTISRLEHRHVTVLLSGIQPHHEQVLRKLGVHDRLAHERHLFATTPEAIVHARVHASRIVHEPTQVATDVDGAVPGSRSGA